MPARHQHLLGLRTLPPELLSNVQLDLGTHSSRSKGVCAMETVAWLAGEPHHQRPATACPTLTDFIITLNDHLPPRERNQLLKPHLANCVGTSDNKPMSAVRAALISDWLIRTAVPIWLSAANWHHEAAKLANLPAQHPAPTHMEVNRLLSILDNVQHLTTINDNNTSAGAQAQSITRESGVHAAKAVHSVPKKAADIAAASAALVVARAHDPTATIHRVHESLTDLLISIACDAPQPPKDNTDPSRDLLALPHMRIPSRTAQTSPEPAPAATG